MDEISKSKLFALLFFFIYIVGINSWYRKCLVRLRDVGGGWRLVGERL